MRLRIYMVSRGSISCQCPRTRRNPCSRTVGLELFLHEHRKTGPDEPRQVELRLLRENLIQARVGRGPWWPEEIADLRPLRHLIRADGLHPVHDFLFVESNEGPEDRVAGNRVDRSKTRDRLAGDLAEVLAGHEHIRGFP